MLCLLEDILLIGLAVWGWRRSKTRRLRQTQCASVAAYPRPTWTPPPSPAQAPPRAMPWDASSRPPTDRVPTGPATSRSRSLAEHTVPTRAPALPLHHTALGPLPVYYDTETVHPCAEAFIWRNDRLIGLCHVDDWMAELDVRGYEVQDQTAGWSVRVKRADSHAFAGI